MYCPGVTPCDPFPTPLSDRPKLRTKTVKIETLEPIYEIRKTHKQKRRHYTSHYSCGWSVMTVLIYLIILSSRIFSCLCILCKLSQQILKLKRLYRPLPDEPEQNTRLTYFQRCTKLTKKSLDLSLLGHEFFHVEYLGNYNTSKTLQCTCVHSKPSILIKRNKKNRRSVYSFVYQYMVY